jgi:hypothetical protein
MKYMLLMQFSPLTADFPSMEAWAPEEVQAHIAFMHDLNGKLTEAGELVEAQGLAGPQAAKIVRGLTVDDPVTGVRHRC